MFLLYNLVMEVIFQLTPSRRATVVCDEYLQPFRHFNSRPHGGRQGLGLALEKPLIISTHALTEGDSISY